MDSNRILPLDGAIGRRWGQRSVELGHHGADLMLAATALKRGHQLAIRNVRAFIPTRGLW